MRTPDVLKIAIVCADDTVAVMSFVTCEYWPSGGVRWMRDGTPKEIEETVRRASAAFTEDKLPIKSWFLMSPAEVEDYEEAPRLYRNALRCGEKGLYHDVEVAKQIHLDLLRVDRNTELEKLDKQWMRAFGQGDLVTASNVESQRQALRDAPQKVAAELAAVQTVEDMPVVALPE